MDEISAQSGSEGLVEPEGVDAGTSGPEDLRPGGHARGGGDPGRAPSPAEPPDEGGALAGVPDQPGAAGPGQELAAGEG